jgi:glycosyltransferase domain-containing protein
LKLTSALTKRLIGFLQEEAIFQERSVKTLSNLTIVIPTYLRQEFILRQCVYWQKSGVNILILDGTPDPLPKALFCALEAFPFVKYIHSPIDFHSRLRLAKDHITTRYAVLCGDDEFLLGSGLGAAILKLDNDPKLVAVIGQSLRYYLANGGEKSIYAKGYATEGYEVRHQNTGHRLEYAFANYNAASCYAVMKSEVWIQSWGAVSKWTSPDIIELQHAFKVYIQGDLISISDVYWMRSVENPPVHSSSHNRRLSGIEWWNSEKFSLEHEMLIQDLSLDLQNFQGFDATSSERIIKDILMLYFSNQSESDIKANAYQRLRLNFASYIKGILPRYVTINIQAFLAKFKKSENEVYGDLNRLRMVLNRSFFSLNEVALKEINYMEKIISKFYKAIS